MSSYKHVMLDLETLGNKSNAAIVSIGAVAFDMDGNIHPDKFHVKIEFESAMERSKINASTLKWWLKQGEDSRKYLIDETDVPQVNARIALEMFKLWLREMFGENTYNVWGNSVRFDNALVEDAFEAWDFGDTPWHFRNEIDARTIGKIDRDLRKQIMDESTGVKHDPVYDAEVQVKWCVAICKKYGITF